MRTKWLEMQGKTVNGFKILEVYRENKRTIVKVVCPACGKIYTTRAETIKNGKDCGCTTRIKMNDLTGKKFGRLTAIEPTERKMQYTSRKIIRMKELTTVCGDTSISCCTRILSKFFGSTKHSKKQ